MAYGYIGHEKNFVFIDGDPLLDVQSVDSNISANRTALHMAGIGVGLQVAEGVSQGEMNLTRYVISDTDHDPFAINTLYYEGFSGLWIHVDSAGTTGYFSMEKAYVNDYNFTAAVNAVPTTQMGLVSYGSGIGEAPGVKIPTPPVPADYLTNYIFPKQIELAFPEANTLSGIVTTNRVQSFSISFTMNREVRNRLGQMKGIPETFIAYPFEASLSIEIDVDEYSIPAIDTLICQETESIELYLKTCDTVFRGFQFTDGVLQSASMNEEVTDMNRATLEYTKYVNSDDDINFWIPV
jgi:hypothetical protein|tara:strand:- start:429 stop:1313 length:885 start_codon:yes stop_codon:yes gene_type:complete